VPARHGRADRLPADSARRVKLFALLAAILILTGGLVWVVSYFAYKIVNPTEPLFVSVVFTEYEDSGLPHNAWAKRDEDLLKQHFVEPLSTYHYQDAGRLLEALAGIGDPKRPLVVYLRAYALRRGEVPCIVPSAPGGLDREADWVALDLVLATLRKCPAQHRLLLLDLMRPLADFRLGIWADDVSGAVHSAVAAQLRELGNPLTVLCACGRDQVSLASEELGHSAFAYYLNAALCGKADGFADGAPDGRVTAGELCAFVTDRVRRWAWVNRGVRQEPVCLASGPHPADFDLTRGEKPVKATPLDDQYPPWLWARTMLTDVAGAKAAPVSEAPSSFDGWELRDHWRQTGGDRYAPAAVIGWGDELLGAEQDWRAGRKAGEIQADLKGMRKKSEEKAHFPKGWHTPKPARSLAEERSRRPPLDPDAREPLDRKLDALAQLGRGLTTASKDQATALQAERAKLAAKVREEYAANRFELSEAIWEAAIRNPERPSIEFLSELLPPTPRNTAPYAETEFLLLLKALMKDIDQHAASGDYVDDPQGLTPSRLQQVLRTKQEAETAVVCDPRAWRSVQKVVEEAVRKQTEGWETLRTKHRRDWARADEALKKAQEAFAGARENARKLALAYEVHERATVMLPAVALYLQAVRDRPRPLEAWKEAVDLSRELGGLLGETAQPDPNRIDEARANLRARLRHLEVPFKDGIEQDLHGVGPRLAQRCELGREDIDLDPESLKRFQEAVLGLHTLLESPLPEGRVRKWAWEEARNLERLLRDETSRAEIASRLPAGGELSTPDEQEQIRRRKELALGTAKLTVRPGGPEAARGVNLPDNAQAVRELLKRPAATDEQGKQRLAEYEAHQEWLNDYHRAVNGRK
jgi:hypothetical protein